MQRGFGQMSLADGLINQRAGRGEWVDRVDRLIDWSRIAHALKAIYASDEGAPSYPHLVMFKLLLLQQWYKLSDAGLEEAVDDRLSFGRFAGMPLHRPVPDHTTIWRFREEIVELGLSAALFEEINRRLDGQGLIVKKGTLIDASLAEANVKKPPFKDGEVSERDPDAGWTKKNGKSHFGYKAHVGVDEGSGLIRKAVMTSADVHDGVPADALIAGDEAAAYGDKAYESGDRRARLRAAGIIDGLMDKARNSHPLKPRQKAFNKAVAVIRASVERTFGLMKRSYGYRRGRYPGLERNGRHLHLLAAAINLRRALALMA